MQPGSIIAREAIPRGTDPNSGAEIVQLTSAPAIHENIYGEVPYSDPSSRYIIYTCAAPTEHAGGHTPHARLEVWRADLRTKRITPVCDNATGIRGVAVSPDQRYFYCQREYAEGEFEILRTEIATLQQKSYRIEGLPEVRSLGSMAPDNTTYVSALRLDKQLFGILKADLEAGSYAVIHEGTEICNAHPQIEPGAGNDILIQHNRGCEFDEQGNIIRSVGDIGATLYLIDSDGGNYRELPVGEPYTWFCQGHQCWTSRTGDILLTISMPRLVGKGSEIAGRLEVISKGNLLRLRPGDAEAEVVARGYYYWHPSVSADARFFVADTIPSGALVVGSLQTGRVRELCLSGASLGGPQYTHPHPYFTPDRKWVIYNSDCTGIPHVYAASVPDGLLEDLQEE